MTSETNPSLDFRFGYTGRERDKETGLQYNRARYYDPMTGGFIGQDPLEFGAGDANLYRYITNNPINFVDPSGLLTILILGGFGNLGALEGNISIVGKFSVVPLGKLGAPSPDFTGQKLRNVISQIAPKLQKGLLSNKATALFCILDLLLYRR